MKKQIIVIHGGDTFESYSEYLGFLKSFQIDFERYREKKNDWKRNLAHDLGDSYEIIALDMPSKQNAKYAEWKIWFEKFIPHLEPEVILIGHSLGGTFLAKYLSENELPRAVAGLFLIAPAYGNTAEYSLADFKIKKLTLLSRQVPKIFIYHSIDDPVVPYADFERYKQELPNAVFESFSDRKHFNQESFPELLFDIKHLI